MHPRRPLWHSLFIHDIPDVSLLSSRRGTAMAAAIRPSHTISPRQIGRAPSPPTTRGLGGLRSPFGALAEPLFPQPVNGQMPGRPRHVVPTKHVSTIRIRSRWARRIQLPDAPASAPGCVLSIRFAAADRDRPAGSGTAIGNATMPQCLNATMGAGEASGAGCLLSVSARFAAADRDRPAGSGTAIGNATMPQCDNASMRQGATAPR